MTPKYESLQDAELNQKKQAINDDKFLKELEGAEYHPTNEISIG